MSTPDKVSVEHWEQWGLDRATVLHQIGWEGGENLSDADRAIVVERFYAENNPHIAKAPLIEAQEGFFDAFHSEVRRQVEAVSGVKQ